MAYYYVKNTGSSTTAGGTTIQSGPFSGLAATAVYASIKDAILYGATSGDFICVSDIHSNLAGETFTYIGPVGGAAFLYMVSVDDTACDTYKKATAAQEGSNVSTNNVNWNGRISSFGLWWYSDQGLAAGVSASAYFNNCTIEVNDNGSYFGCIGDGGYISFKNGAFIGGGYMSASGGSVVEVIGGTVDTIASVVGGGFTAGGGTMKFFGVDLSTAASYLVAVVGSSDGDDAMNVEFSRCKLHADVAVLQETLIGPRMRVTVTNSTSVSAEAEYQYSVVSFGAQVEDIDTIYRAGSTAFPSGQKTSLKCTTLSTCATASPFWFDCPTRYAELSNTASDTLRVYLQSAVVLYDSDVWLEATYPDGTTKQLPHYVNTRHTEILDTNGTPLGTNTQAWVGALAYKYHIDIDTSGNAGADCWPTIRVYVAKPSATIYFCPSVDVR
jgi:hypothetical protein